jgi:hypothetical protein
MNFPLQSSASDDVPIFLFEPGFAYTGVKKPVAGSPRSAIFDILLPPSRVESRQTGKQ